jgi:hypothetical protein
MSDDIRLDLLRDAICRSDLDGQTKDALLDEIKALGRKQKVSPADLKAVAEKHGKSKANPGKKEK